MRVNEVLHDLSSRGNQEALLRAEGGGEVNALELVPQDMPNTDGYWIGRLSMLAACQLKRDPVAREALDEFLRSPVPSPWLKSEIRREMSKR